MQAQCSFSSHISFLPLHSGLNEESDEAFFPFQQQLIFHMTVSSAQVLLGVTPTILAVLGASASELSMVSVVAQRPFLSLLLALGSPSVFVSRAFELGDPAELLRDRKGRLRPDHLRSPARRRLVAAAQYVAAAGAVANVAELDWELGIKTVCTFWPDNVIGPNPLGPARRPRARRRRLRPAPADPADGPDGPG